MTSPHHPTTELKRGAIRPILLQAAQDWVPDFEFLVYRRGSYYFQRIRQVHGWNVYEILDVLHSLQERCFDCSVASVLNPDYIFSTQYNSGLIHPKADLKRLRHPSGGPKIQDAYYFYDGHVEGATQKVREIFAEYQQYGLPFLDAQLAKVTSNKIIHRGWEYIDRLQVDRQNLKKEISDDLDRGGLSVTRIKHPIYLELKEQLQAVPGQTRADRQEIPRAAYELLEIYWSR